MLIWVQITGGHVKARYCRSTQLWSPVLGRQGWWRVPGAHWPAGLTSFRVTERPSAQKKKKKSWRVTEENTQCWPRVATHICTHVDTHCVHIHRHIHTRRPHRQKDEWNLWVFMTDAQELSMFINLHSRGLHAFWQLVILQKSFFITQECWNSNYNGEKFKQF